MEGTHSLPNLRLKGDLVSTRTDAISLRSHDNDAVLRMPGETSSGNLTSVAS